jgi:hypothetical protein
VVELQGPCIELKIGAACAAKHANFGQGFQAVPWLLCLFLGAIANGVLELGSSSSEETTKESLHSRYANRFGLTSTIFNLPAVVTQCQDGLCPSPHT